MNPEKPHSLPEIHTHLARDKKMRDNGGVRMLRKGHYEQIESAVSSFLATPDSEPIDYVYDGLHGNRSFLLRPRGYDKILLRISSEVDEPERRAYHEDIQQPVFARVMENKKHEKILVEIVVNSVDKRVGKKSKIALDLPDIERLAPDLFSPTDVSFDFLKPKLIRAIKNLINLQTQPKHESQGMSENFFLKEGVMAVGLSALGELSFCARMLDGHELSIKDPEKYAEYIQKTGLHTLAEEHGQLSSTFAHLEKYFSESARAAIARNRESHAR